MIDNCNINSLAKNPRSLLFFFRALFAEVCYRALYGDATNMAAGNQLKNLSLSFATKA